MNKVIILGGGTIYDIRSHFGLIAPAIGKTASQLYKIAKEMFDDMEVNMKTTMVAGDIDTNAKTKEFKIRTNNDVETFMQRLIADKTIKIIFFNIAMCDWEAEIDGISGRYAKRLNTHDGTNPTLKLTPSKKIIDIIKKDRKDIFLIGFKQTAGYSEEQQYSKGLNLLKQASCNLVLANDSITRNNIIIVPEEAHYGSTNNRNDALVELCEITKSRSKLHFTPTNVIDGQIIRWLEPIIPGSFRKVVDYCISHSAYKPFRNITTGHFAFKIDDHRSLSSIRKSNYKNIYESGMVLVVEEEDSVTAHGAKPSAGSKSQRAMFRAHQEYDCVIHFHCPLKENPKDNIPIASQREFECGSHECAMNTSDNMREFGNIKAVYLSEHGPNILFNRNTDPDEIIEFIEANFDLNKKTGGIIE